MSGGQLGCCEGFDRLDLNKVSLSIFENMAGLIDWTDPNILYSAALIVFKPFYWLGIARIEWHTHIFSALCGSAYRACYVFGISILMMGCVRDWRFNEMMASQPKLDMLDGSLGMTLGVLFIIMGSTLVLTSFWALGFTGTFLGDYFGIYLEERVTGFPFNVTDNPMYWGTTMNFVGFAIWNASPAGLMMILLIVLIYKIIIYFEEPFTAMIYREKAERGKKSA